MRGYGSSTIHNEPLAYCQELVVMDMIGLLDHLDLGKAVWVRHDWGSPTVWNIAAHFPERRTATITLDVPFGMLGAAFRACYRPEELARDQQRQFVFG